MKKRIQPKLPLWIGALMVWLPGGLSAQDTPDAGKPDEAEQKSVVDDLRSEQQELAARYKLLEEKLFKLYEYEKERNPERSELLRRAFETSKERFTHKQLETIAQLLATKQLRQAQDRQQDAVKDLVALLELLKSGDRSKRIRDKIKRFQDYLDEVNRIARIQQGIRGQAEGGVEKGRLENSQDKNASRTSDLAKQIAENESAGGAEESEPSANGSPGGEGTPGGEPSTDQESQQNSDANPVEGRLQAAQQRMEEAKKKLEDAKRDESIEAMREAERELAAAKRELEEILKQLREEEIGRSLARLESRFRKMLEREVRVYEKTKQLHDVPSEVRRAEFEIRAGKISVEQRQIHEEAGRALLLLREDGSSIAFPETVEQMQEDMMQIAGRLSAARVGLVTQEIEEDVIETLDYLIAALVQAQRDLDENSDDRSQQGNGAPGDQPLVDQIAELKMIRGLQHRINKRHERYSKLLEDPENPIGQTDDPELRDALRRLSERQQALHQITQDIVAGKNE